MRTPRGPIVAGVVDPATPPAFYGCAVVRTNAQTWRAVQPTDTRIDGIFAQPYPYQNPFPNTGLYGAQDFNAFVVPTPNHVGSIVVSGFVGVPCFNSSQATMGTSVYVWTGPTGNGHINSGFELSPSVVTAATPKAGGNTGNGSLGTVAATNAAAGNFTLAFTSATAFTVTAPGGATLPGGTVGTPYNAGGLQFTVTAGSTPFANGDQFTLTVSTQTIQLDTKSYFTGNSDVTGVAELAINL